MRLPSRLSCPNFLLLNLHIDLQPGNRLCNGIAFHATVKLCNRKETNRMYRRLLLLLVLLLVSGLSFRRDRAVA